MVAHVSKECPTPHRCPHCRCVWELTDDMGRVDKDAPFYRLVELVDAATPRNQHDRKVPA